MKILLRVFFLLLIGFSVKSQTKSPSGLPSPYNTSYYRIGWLKADSGSIIANRDTTLRPLFPGTEVFWLHQGVDTTNWLYDGVRWKKLGTGNSVTPTVYQNQIQWQNQGNNIGTVGAANVVNVIGNGVTSAYNSGVITISVTTASSARGIISINGDTTSNAIFVNGYAGTSPNIVTSHGVSTWNNPIVNTFDTGIVTPALFNTWNNKQNALTFGNLTSTTLSLAGNTGAVIGGGATVNLPAIVTSGSCTNCTIALDVYGRITSYSNGTFTNGTVTSVSGSGTVNGLTLTGTVTTVGNLILGGTLSGITNANLSGSAGITSSNLAATGVTAGAYTNSNITVNQQGQIVSISNGSGGGGGSTITNVGSGFDIAYAGTNNVKRITAINGIIGDTSVSNTFRLQVDSSKYATKSFVNLGFVPNAGNTTSIQEGLLSARPLAGITGRLYYTTDPTANFIYLDNGSGWVRVDSVAAAPPQSFQTTLNIGNTINRNDSIIGNFAFTFASNSAIQIPGGNTSQAPSNALGWLRYNSDSSYNGFGNRPTFNNGTGYHMLAYVSDIPTSKDSIFTKAGGSAGTGFSILYANGSDTVYGKKVVASTGITITQNVDSSLGFALTNSTISGVSLGSNLFSHTNGYGLLGSAYNGSAAQTWNVDSTKFAVSNDSTGSGTNTWVTRTYLNTQAYLKNITGLVTPGTNVTVTGSGTSGSPYVINSIGGGGTSFTNQNITSGSSATGSASPLIVTFNPSSAFASFAFTMPASPNNNDVVVIQCGGTISAGVVISSFTISANTGQTIVDPNPPQSFVAGQHYSLRYSSTYSNWYPQTN